jgi:hypothetical protein
MSVPEGTAPVSADETLARFVTIDRWIRADQTIRQDAFIPPKKDLNLSVTRHLHLSQTQLWRIGQTVADARGPGRLFGRADLTVLVAEKASLRVEPAPLPANPQHAHINGWPLDKPAQKNVAQQLAAASRFVSRPPG